MNKKDIGRMVQDLGHKMQKAVHALHLRFFIFLLALMSSSNIHAGIVTYTNTLTVGGSPLFEYGAVNTVDDGLPVGAAYANMQGIVTFGINWDLMSFNSTYPANQSYVTEVTVIIKGWNPAGTQIVNTTEVLKVYYNPVANTTELDKSVYACTGVRKLEATITGIKINGSHVTATGATLPNNLYLTTDVIVERYMSFNTSTVPSITIPPIIPTDNTHTIAWGAISGAEEYDVEWTFVDQYDVLQTYNFTNNSTRVTIPATITSYAIPVIYPTGKLVFRVRGRGRDLSPPYTTITYGSWSLATVSGNVSSLTTTSRYDITTGIESLKNWQYSISFAEEGKHQQVIAYFDGTLRNRQNLTRSNTEQIAIVSQTIYDHIGRPSIQTLPVPAFTGGGVADPSLLYKNDFNQDPTGNNYTWDDFDTSSTACNMITRSMKNTSGASRYYSVNNPLDNNSPANAYNYIPDAYGYPFTQVEYMDDNTNRIRRQSGVGKNHRLTGKDENGNDIQGKESRYYYATPFQPQLDRLFGNEVGFFKHYKKNAVIDANGQISVSYLDPYGRVIATALAGDTINTPSLDPVESANTNTPLSVHLIDSMQVDYQDLALTTVATHLVTSQGLHSFTYTVEVPAYTHCLPANWCFDCVYDLTLSIKDECGNELVPESLRTQMVGQIDTVCDSIFFTLSPSPLDLNLNVGTYVISKKLQVNLAAIDAYTNLFIENSPCLLTLEDFIEDQMALIDSSECLPGTCQDCIDRLGTYSQHNDTTRKYDPGYDFLTMDQYNAAIAQCNSMCEVNTPCDALYQQMLADVSPGGQYMTYGTGYVVTDALSFLNIPSGLMGDYTNFGPYHNTDGSLSFVTIDGVQYAPVNLPVNHFVEYWQPSWAQNLVTHHPEYCYYQYCMNNEDSYIYDINMMSTPTYEAALDSGFLDPINTALSFPHDHLDPYFFTGVTPNALHTDMNNALTNCITTPLTLSLWGIIDYIQDNQINASTGTNACWTDYDWAMFRGIYISKKQEIWKQEVEDISSCPYFGAFSGDPFSLGLKTPRYIFDTYGSLGSSDLTYYDIDITSSSTPQDLADEAAEFMEGYCDTTCSAYANEWMYRLEGCSLTVAEYDEIRFRLIESCKGNCDAQNPTGGLESDEVEEILGDVLGPSYMNAGCNPLLISSIPIVQHNYFGMAALDSCACDKLEDLRNNYDSLETAGGLPSGVCSIQDYFAEIYGENMAAQMPDLSLLECYCGFAEVTIDTIIVAGSLRTIEPDTIIVTSNCYDILNYESTHPGGFMSPSETYVVCEVGGPLVPILNDVSIHGGLFDDVLIDSTNWEIDTGYASIKLGLFQYPNSCDDAAYDGLTVQAVSNNKIHQQFQGHASLRLFFTGGDSCDVDPNADSLYIVAVGSLSSVSVTDLQNIDHFDFQVKKPLGLPNTGVYLTAVLNNGKKILMHTLQHAQLSLVTLYCDTVVQEFNPPMVPFELTCQQCLTCALIDSSFSQLTEEYPFILSITDTVEVLTYLTNYINANFNTNFTYLQLANNMELCDSSLDPDTLEFCHESMFTTYSIPSNPCLDFLVTNAITTAEEYYQDYIDSVTATFRDSLIAKCMGAFETFDMEYTEKEFHYTLFYYDQGGNLIKTVPPQGVTVITDAPTLAAVQNHRLNPFIYPTRIIPGHELITNYRYNTLNLLTEQHTPDAGRHLYWYDELGRLVVSQDSHQASKDLYSYTIYDALGRIKEIGEVEQATPLTHANSANQAYLTGWINGASSRKQVTTTVYDATSIAGLPFTAGQQNLRNRVVYTSYKENYNSNDTIYDAATHYTYDIHGNVKQMVQENTFFESQGQQFKNISYMYDLISGNVLVVSYQAGKKDQYYHKYAYDADNRLTTVKTSRDNILWDLDAKYIYYKHGPLARTELGDNKVQGTDYAYTLHGWTKGMNSNTLQVHRDIGADAKSGSIHAGFARDAAGFSLGYFEGYTIGSVSYPSDYTSLKTFTVDSNFTSSVTSVSGNVIASNQRNLFNGNISYMITGIPNCSTYNASKIIDPDPLGAVYRYDQLNRITQMQAFLDKSYLVTNNQWNLTSANNGMTYYSNYKYDANGNLKKLNLRGDQTGSNLSQDSLVYTYATGAGGYYNGQTLNRLAGIAENQTSAARYSGDIDNNSNYAYTLDGNLTDDTGEEIDNIQWNVMNKVLRVTRNPGSSKSNLEFRYNAHGQRVIKIEKPNSSGNYYNQAKWIYTYYVHDASGNMMSTYTMKYKHVSGNEYEERMYVSNYMMYGSGRLGTKEDTLTLSKRKIRIDSWVADSSFNAVTVLTNYTLPAIDLNHAERWTGNKEYELKNHLGNVLATVTDRKVAVSTSPHTTVTYWQPDINTVYDYYPFGAPMPGRNLSLAPCSTQVNTLSQNTVNEAFGLGSLGGFTSLSGATLSNASGTLKIQKGGAATSGWGGKKTFTQVNGEVYSVSFSLGMGTCTGKTIKVEIKNPGGTVLATQTYTTGGSKSFSFTANSSGTGSFEITMSSAASCDFNIDNVMITYQYKSISTACASGTESYMFGHNGKEKVNEQYGEGNFYDYGFRVYDSRIGRFLSVDPLKMDYPELSTYQFAGNTPIQAIDLDGLEPVMYYENGMMSKQFSGPINKEIIEQTKDRLFTQQQLQAMGVKPINSKEKGYDESFVRNEDSKLSNLLTTTNTLVGTTADMASIQGKEYTFKGGKSKSYYHDENGKAKRTYNSKGKINSNTSYGLEQISETTKALGIVGDAYEVTSIISDMSENGITTKNATDAGLFVGEKVLEGIVSTIPGGGIIVGAYEGIKFLMSILGPSKSYPSPPEGIEGVKDNTNVDYPKKVPPLSGTGGQ